MSKTSRSVRLTAAHRGLEPSPHDLRSAEPTLVPVRAPPRRLADAERPLAPVRAPPHGLQSVPGTVRLQRPASYTRARVVYPGTRRTPGRLSAALHGLADGGGLADAQDDGRGAVADPGGEAVAGAGQVGAEGLGVGEFEVAHLDGGQGLGVEAVFDQGEAFGGAGDDAVGGAEGADDHQFGVHDRGEDEGRRLGGGHQEVDQAVHTYGQRVATGGRAEAEGVGRLKRARLYGYRARRGHGAQAGFDTQARWNARARQS